LNQLVQIYRESTKFQQKLNTARDVLFEIFKIINKNYVEFKFFNYLSDSNSKYPLWREYAEETKSLSGVYLLSFVLISELKWHGPTHKKAASHSSQKKNCMNCGQQDGLNSFKRVVNLDGENFEERLKSQGCVLCRTCSLPIHKVCTEESSRYGAASFRCQKCEEAKLGYTLEEADDQLEDKLLIKSADISTSNFCYGARTRKQITNIIDSESDSNSTTDQRSEKNLRSTKASVVLPTRSSLRTAVIKSVAESRNNNNNISSDAKKSIYREVDSSQSSDSNQDESDE
jgi:hypothetical protein